MATFAHDITAVVGRRVRAHRLALQLNQQQLAWRSGMSQPTISRIEKGEGPLDASTALQLANGLGVRVGALLEPTYTAEAVITAARPGTSTSAMSTMRAAAVDYLANYRRATGAP